MLRLSFVLLAICFVSPAFSQGNSFSFGATYRELEMKVYDKDTSASAVVLREFGEAYIDNSGNNNLIFEYHSKIKILKKEGLHYADVEIPLYKSNGKKERLVSVKASSYIIENSSLKEVSLDTKQVYTDNKNEYWDIVRFAIPAAHEGCVIEFYYKLESPWIFKFREWKFQSDIPKVHSEYWATIPGNYIYNMTLRGFLKMTKSHSQLIKDCFVPGGGNRADCVRYKYTMEDVPAFVNEEYMTAPSNFISAINFELSELRYFDGRVDKVTKEWRDAEQELRLHQNFGTQLRKAKDIAKDIVPDSILSDQDEFSRAKRIFNRVKFYFDWNERYGILTDVGVKKAYDSKIGNVADINLVLIAAFQYAKIDTDPVILSTRENGLPIEIHPVLSDFNYVIARVKIGDKFYFADAVDDFIAFGNLPERCMNGRGRLLGDRESSWIELNPAEKTRQVAILTLRLDSLGVLSGRIQSSFFGNDAVRERKKYYSRNSETAYINGLEDKLTMDITSYKIENAEALDKPFVQNLDVRFENSVGPLLLLNPFLLNRWKYNPFRSVERLYPVDFGTAIEQVMLLNIEFADNYMIDTVPEKLGLVLPNGGGRYILDTQYNGNRLSVNSSLTLSRAIYNSEEYHYLKELFNRIIQVQNTDLVFKRN